jgi:hypothetical protein
MSKREKKVSVHVHEQALKLMELESNLLSTANALKDERLARDHPSLQK